MADVFISYSHPNREQARAIANQLSAAGASVWWDRELVIGDDFGAEILRQLKEAVSVVVLWTEQSIESHYVRDEAGVALSQRKLIPVASEKVNPPLGFRSVHVLRIGPAGIEDDDFVLSLVRAVEAHIHRTLERRPLAKTSTEPIIGAESELQTSFVVPLGDTYTTIAVTLECVWLGKASLIEARDKRGGNILGQAKAQGYTLVLLTSPTGNDVMCCSWGLGYQGPDTIRVGQWKLSASLEDVRKKTQSAEAYEPGYRDCSKERYQELVRGENIGETDLFHIWSWQQGPAAMSEDGNRIAIYADEPKRQIVIWSAASGRNALPSIPLGQISPDGFIFLRGGDELITIERSRKGEKSYISVWSVPDSRCVARHELDYVTVNSVCRTKDPGQVALGLDQSVAFMNVKDGQIVEQIETGSRPVVKCAFDPERCRLGLVTDKELALIDCSTMRRWRSIGHGHAKGVDCDLRGQTMSALVTADNGKSALIVWDLEAEEHSSPYVSMPEERRSSKQG